MAVAPEGLPKALHVARAARAPRRGRAALHVQPHRGLRARHAVPPGDAGRPRLPRRHLGRRPRRVRRPAVHVPRRRRGRAPLRRRRRARLDDHRRGRDPRPGARGVAASPSTRRPAARCSSRTFRHAIEVGKRARTETGIGRHAVSVSSAAVALAAEPARHRSTAAACSCSAPARWARAWRSRSRARACGEIVVANRTAGRGRGARGRASAAARSRLDEVPDALVECDVLLVVHRRRRRCSSSAATIETVMERRDGRALLVVDIGVPRNVDPGVGEVFGVTLLDIDDLRAFGEQSLAQRRQEIGNVREIIAEELDRYRIERTAREVAPLVTALRARAEDVRAAELERHRGQARRARPRGARRGRRAHAQHRQQAAPRADRAPEGRRRHRARRALRRRARRAVRPARARRRPDGTTLMPRALRVATRGSALARWQAERVAALLGGDAELVIVTTTGDARTDAPIHAIGGTGVFVKEVQQAVLDGRADVAVHSAKDLPVVARTRRPRARRGPRAGRPARRARRVARSTALPTGARVGTGSVRRRAQLAGAAARPHVRASCAATSRPASRRPRSSTRSWSRPPRSTASGSRPRRPSCLDPSVMLPQVGQGALAVECRADDARDARAARRDRRRATRTRRSTPSARSSPSSAAAATCPCGALAARRRRRGRDRGAARVARRPRRAARRRARTPIPVAVGPRARRQELLDHGGRSTARSTRTAGRDRLPRRRRARRPRAAHRARRRAARAAPTSSSTTGSASPTLLDARARPTPS